MAERSSCHKQGQRQKDSDSKRIEATEEAPKGKDETTRNPGNRERGSNLSWYWLAKCFKPGIAHNIRMTESWLETVGVHRLIVIGVDRWR